MRTISLPRATLLLGAAVLAAPAAAQSFSYPDFSSTNGLVLNPNATQVGTLLRVSSATISDKGSVWYDTPVKVDGGFDTTFEFQLSQFNAGGGDGLAFVIQNDPDGSAALGDHASAMGYGAFASSPTSNAVGNSLVVEVDTFLNGNWNDLDGNHISVHTNGSGDNSQDEDFSIGRAPAGVDLSNGQVHSLRIVQAQGMLEIFLDGSATPLISEPYDFVTGGTWLNSGSSVGGVNLMGGTDAYVGFTAGAGASWENHDLLSWSFTSGATILYCAQTKPTSVAGCLPELSATSPSVASGHWVTTDVPFGPGVTSSVGIHIYTAGLGIGPSTFTAPTSFGTLCLSGFLRALPPVVTSGASNSCTGTFDFDFGANFAALQADDPNLQVGNDINVMLWYRDPPNAGLANFSNAMFYTLAP